MQRPDSLTKLIFLLAFLYAPLSQAKCQTEPAAVYQHFKNYRLKLAHATRLEQLSPFFSSRFNQYYLEKLSPGNNDHVAQDYLKQYWLNLNTAQDIVIVYEYALHCTEAATILQLTTILGSKYHETPKIATL